MGRLNGLVLTFFKETHGHVQLTLMKGHHHIVTRTISCLRQRVCVCVLITLAKRCMTVTPCLLAPHSTASLF